jgi:hypothetical protein
MRERGGPTTQSGILYQNSVAALYLGRLCDEAPRPDSERVVRVRVESPDHVDDTVLTYANGRVAYIQSKETVRRHEKAWRALWMDFLAQYHTDAFIKGRDCLQLHIGEPRDEHYDLRELCNRARTSPEVREWSDRLTAPQRDLVAGVGKILGPELSGADEALRSFLAHVDVVIWPSAHVEEWVPQFIPATSIGKQTLFQLLRDSVGGTARHRGIFEAFSLREELATQHAVEFKTPTDIETLRAAIRNCGALLRQHKNTLGTTGIHLRREVTSEIESWVLSGLQEDAVAMLLDGAGTGKTVVMRDLLVSLEERGTTVLGIKADQQFSGVNNVEDVQQKLGFPEPVERVVSRLAVLGPVVVIVDQVDALSLSLARDQRALNEVLALVGRLRQLPGVVVLLSCRRFDRNTDPRLRRLDVGREFALPILSNDEVDGVLGRLNRSAASNSGNAGTDPDTSTPGPIHQGVAFRWHGCRQAQRN